MRGIGARTVTPTFTGTLILGGLLAALTAASPVAADEPKWTLGGHYGGDVIEDLNEDVDSASIYARRQLAMPDWLVRWSPRGTRIHADATLSRISADDDGSTQLALGPVLEWRSPRGPWRLAAGVQPTWISDHDLSDRDLGGPIQFTSHIGAGVELGERALIELQWRHISNAELYEDNDGIDVQVLSVGWRF